MNTYICVYIYISECTHTCIDNIYICIYGCCPSSLVPEMATFTRKTYFRETFTEPSPCMILITSSFSKRKRKRERARER